MTTYTTEIDASGKPCPAPIFNASKALKGMNNGEVLKLIATDIGTIKDIPAMCDQLNVELINTNQADGSYFYYIKK